LEDHIKIDPRKYAMRIWHMLGTHILELCSIKGEVILSVVKTDILFMPQNNNPCLGISTPVSVFLGENLRFGDVLSVN
jgi:hypothetical protein